jgi:hypothetical protein
MVEQTFVFLGASISINGGMERFLPVVIVVEEGCLVFFKY